MECRICGTSLVGIERACPSCFAYIEREPPRPAREEPPPPVTAEDGSAALALEAVQPEAVLPPVELEPVVTRCPAHPTQPMAGVCGRCGAFVCRECDPRPDQPSARCGACRDREEAAGAEGIGGWLWLPAIGCVVQPVAFGGLGVFLLMRMNADVNDAMVLRAFVSLAMCAFTTVTAVCFFLKKRFVPALMIVWLVLSFLVTLFTTHGSTEHVLRSAMTLAIWAPYFMVSRRVKRTFVR